MDLPFVPERASSMAGQIDAAFLRVRFCSRWSSWRWCSSRWGTFLYTYRKGSEADRTPLNFQTWKIEVAWSAIPLMIAMGFFVWGDGDFYRLKTPPPDADSLEVNVIGKQWMWNVQHPEGKRELNELHVPLGRTVRLVMTSQDVIHDFYIPGLPHEAGCGAGPVFGAVVQGDQARQFPPLLQPALRDGPLGDGRLGNGDDADRLPAMAQRGRRAGLAGGARRASVPLARLQRLPRRERPRARAEPGRVIRPSRPARTPARSSRRTTITSTIRSCCRSSRSSPATRRSCRATRARSARRRSSS